MISLVITATILLYQVLILFHLFACLQGVLFIHILNYSECTSQITLLFMKAYIKMRGKKWIHCWESCSFISHHKTEELSKMHKPWSISRPLKLPIRYENPREFPLHILPATHIPMFPTRPLFYFTPPISDIRTLASSYLTTPQLLSHVTTAFSTNGVCHWILLKPKLFVEFLGWSLGRGN